MAATIILILWVIFAGLFVNAIRWKWSAEAFIPLVIFPVLILTAASFVGSVSTKDYPIENPVYMEYVVLNNQDYLAYSFETEANVRFFTLAGDLKQEKEKKFFIQKEKSFFGFENSGNLIRK